MLKKILLGTVGILVVLCGIIAMQPSTYSVQRSATFKASPDVAFALVNDFHNWGGWSPWDKMDPSQKTTFEGAATGVGAKYGWSGNDQVGEGRMTIEKSEPTEITVKLEFLKPFTATNTTTFTFVKTPEGNETTWAMSGHNNFVSKAFDLFLDMDKVVGDDFERGLRAMKAAAEAAPQAPSVAVTTP